MLYRTTLKYFFIFQCAVCNIWKSANRAVQCEDSRMDQMRLLINHINLAVYGLPLSQFNDFSLPRLPNGDENPIMHYA